MNNDRSVRARPQLKTMLVGRDAELAELKQAWDAAALGEVRCVYLRGSAGTGKTALVRELISRYGARGFFAHVSAPQPLPSGQPLIASGVSALVRQFLGRDDHTLSRLTRALDDTSNDLRRQAVALIPELKHLYPVPPLPGDSHAAEIVRRIVGAAGQPELPAVIFLDDCVPR